MIRAVLDTNVIVSALLFSGPPAQLVSAWQSGRLRPVVSALVLDEYVRGLAYPKFSLTAAEIRGLLDEELLPFIETVIVAPAAVLRVRDPDDAKFVDCAVAAHVHWLVSGDDDLLSLGRVQSVEIVSPSAFMHQLKLKR